MCIYITYTHYTLSFSPNLCCPFNKPKPSILHKY